MSRSLFVGLRHALTLCIASVLWACASTPVPELLEPRPPRAGIAHFALEARAIIRQGERADSLRMAWTHSLQHDVVSFISPLGQKLAELQRDQAGARWLGADGERAEAARPDELFARLTEVPVPLDAMSEWMLGRVSTQATNLRQDELGRLLSAQDRGWQIQVLAYENASSNALPSRLELTHGELRIRLAIENWTL